MAGTQEKEGTAVLFAYRLFYTLLLASSAYGYLREQLTFQGNILLQFFALGLSLALLAAVDCGRGRVPFYFACAILGAAALNGFFREPEKLLTGEKQTLLQKLLWGPQLKELCSMVFLAILVYFLWLLAESFWRVRLGLTALIVLGLAASVVFRIQVPYWSVAAVLLYLASTVTEGIQGSWKKVRQGGNRLYFLWLVPFLALYFVLTGLAPYRDTPYDWHFVRVIYQRVQKEFIKLTQNLFWAQDEDFGLPTSGFSENSGFFGSMGKNDRQVICLKGWPAYGEGVYLTGKIFDVFDGRNWSFEGQGTEEDPWLDTLETRYAVQRYGIGQPLDYVRNTELKIEYRYFRTKYLFAPLKTAWVEAQDYGAGDGAFRFRKKRGYGTFYRLSYGQMNSGHSDFIGLLQSQPLPESEEIWSLVVRESGRDYPLQTLKDYQRRMRSQYLIEPEIGERVRAWLDGVLGSADTEYEKLQRLERALREYGYTLRPGELPQEVCSEKTFLEYFLLESREGYCTYFATAFVLLARAEGIPARYVQGFCIPGKALGGWSEQETLVTSNMAHAWPEVYLEGFGWIAFEPTPGFGQYRSVSWKTAGDREKEKEKEKEEQSLPEESTKREEGPTQEQTEQRETEEAPKEEGLSVWERIRLAAFLLGVLAALFTLFLAADALWERISGRRRSPMENLRLEFLRNLQILDMLGCGRKETETLSELAEKLSGEGEEMSDGRSAEFIRTCEEVLYGARAVDGQTAKEVHDAGMYLLRELKRRKGRSYPLWRTWLYLTRAR